MPLMVRDVVSSSALGEWDELGELDDLDELDELTELDELADSSDELKGEPKIGG